MATSRSNNDIAEGWPADAKDAADLAAFGKSLRADRPELSDGAMHRIERAMWLELERPDAAAWRWRRTAYAAAASILLASGIWTAGRAFLQPNYSNQARVPSGQPSGADGVHVRDRYSVSLRAVPMVPSPEWALFRPNEYAELVGLPTPTAAN